MNVFFPLALSGFCSALPTYSGENAPSAAFALQGLGDGLNFNFTSSTTPQPFTVNVDPAFIATTELKVNLYRPSRAIAVPDWTDGPPTYNLTNVQQYWLQNYSWFDVQADINAKYAQYTTSVSAGENFTEPVQLHFAHQVSNRSDSIPLLLLHGWPSSFLEWDSVIDALANPPNATLPSFNAVAVDLPGFGFSPAPTTPGLGSREMGVALDNLMKQLGYNQYAIYTTDLGSFIGRWMTFDAPGSIISRLTDFYFVAPNATDLQRYAANETTPGENTFIEGYNLFNTIDFGYFAEQSTRPLALAESLSDSPLGFLAWMWQLRHVVSGSYIYTAQELITDALMLFIPGVYGNVRSYKTFQDEGGLNDTAYPSSNTPVGVTHWPSGPLEVNDPFQYAVSVCEALTVFRQELTVQYSPHRGFNAQQT